MIKGTVNSGKLNKSRHEYKYRVSSAQIVLVRERIRNIMKPDSHAEDGQYEIRSVYFDDMNNTCYNKNEAGVDPRAKYRIRIYNANDSVIRLEKKVKLNGMTRKYSAKLSRQQAEALIMGKGLSMDGDAFKQYPDLLKQFLILYETRYMRAKVIVSYDRIPYIYEAGNVRVTFDTNISASNDFEHFFEKDMQKIPVMGKGQELMEVKYDEFLPKCIQMQLETGRLRQETFSKFYLCMHSMNSFSILTRREI